MEEYIGKGAAISMVQWIMSDSPSITREDWNAVVDGLSGIPPADVRPVVRGRWILDIDPGEPWKYKCDQCGETTTSTCMEKPRYNYCPMCGAFMSENDA